MGAEGCKSTQMRAAHVLGDVLLHTARAHKDLAQPYERAPMTRKALVRATLLSIGDALPDGQGMPPRAPAAGSDSVGRQARGAERGGTQALETASAMVRREQPVD
jgi:hypothetical protein